MIVCAGRGKAAWPWVLSVLLVLLPMLAHAQARHEFNLPVQPLADALRAVGRKAHVTVAFDPVAVEGRRAPALKGGYTAEEALARLLKGSRLRVRRTAGGSFWVEAIPTRGPPAG